MIRRRLMAASVTALLLVAGCGSFKLAHNGEPVWLRHRVDQPFEEPAQRVALAAYEVLRGELPAATLVAQELSVSDRFDRKDGTTPTPAELTLPADAASFWLDGVRPAQAVVTDFHFCELIGTDKEGREIQVVVRSGFPGQEAKTFVSVQVGRRGDDALSRVWLSKITDRVSHPTASPGSPDETKALQDLFGPTPGQASEKARATIAGNLWMKRL